MSDAALPNLLNLPSYVVLSVKETEYDTHVWAETTEPRLCCEECKTRDQIVGFGRRKVLVHDIPAFGKRVGIYVNVRRLQCKRCDRVWMEDLPDVDTKRDMTDRLVRWISQESLKRAFTSVAEDCGVAEGTVRSVFKDYVRELEGTVRFETPECLGIDEVHLVKRPRAVFANLGQCTLINMLRDRNKRTVVAYLRQIDHPGRIRRVTMDMWVPYKSAVHETLPKARIIVDKFHVVRMANQAMETIRKSLRASLSPKERKGLMHDRFVLLRRERDLTPENREVFRAWVQRYPFLGVAYGLKEAFYGIYDAESRGDAKALYKDWLLQLKLESSKTIGPVLEAFAPLTTAVGNWRDDIFSYFDDYRLTNACTESLNALVKQSNRIGRGYSYEAVRARVLYSTGVHKVEKPKFSRVEESGTIAWGAGAFGMGLPPQDGEVNYGASIPLLVKMIEEGKL